MMSKSSAARLAFRAYRSARPLQGQCRAFSASSSGQASFEKYDASGVKIASRDASGPTATLAVVAKAGTRYQPLPSLTVGLEEFAFKNTTKRSALRITREAELLGGQLTSYHTREAIVLQASFLRDDIPYFTELLAEMISQTKYTTHEFHEDVERVMHLKQAKQGVNPAGLALDAAHSVAFHTGLGAPLYPKPSSPKSYLDEHAVADFALAAYAKSNIALVADGVSQTTLSKWAGKFFEDVPASSSGGLGLNMSSSTYYGGEQRSEHAGGNAMVIAFPVSAAPDIAVLTALLGGPSSVKWSPGSSILGKVASSTGAAVSATNLVYSDAGLLAIQITGTAVDVRTAAMEAIKALKAVAGGSVAKEDVAKAAAKAKFDALEKSEVRNGTLLSVGTSIVHGQEEKYGQAATAGIDSVTPEKLKSAAKALLDGKASVAAVGDLHVLPFAEELGLMA